METTRAFVNDGDRYRFDFGECSTGNGFAQVDTGQDAWFFGTWANPFSRKIVSYAEGDITRQKAETDEEFCAELQRVKAFWDGTGYGFKGIDPGFNAPLAEQFKALGLGDLLH